MLNRILILHGPNLNLLGQREPEVYGRETLADINESLSLLADELAVATETYQSNHEGNIVDKIQEIGFQYDGIVINAGAFTHTSIAIRDAIAAVTTPVIEVHISNVYNREDFRKQSFISAVCKGSIVGLGLEGYRLAIRYFADR